MIATAAGEDENVTYVHEPVMLSEVLAYVARTRPRRIVDCTVGGAGHAAALLAAYPDAELLGLDRDPEAVAAARARLTSFAPRAQIVHAPFSAVDSVLAARGWTEADVIFADLGVSSYQLDVAERGFSFRFDAALDMRMDPTQGQSAAALIALMSERELAQVIAEWGEERHARRLAREIVKAQPQTTAALAQLVRSVVHKSADGLDPATRTFQALRLAVNRELDELTALLGRLPVLLAGGGIAVVLSYHSLEDRAVKTAFRAEAKDCICPPELPACACGHVATLKILTPRPLTPAPAEQATNPRSRSAKLRAALRLTRPA